MTSVAIGLLAGTGVLALYKGMMKSRIRTVIDAETAHLQIHHPLFKQDYHPVFVIPGAGEVLRKVQSFPGVQSAAPRSIAMGMLVTTTGSAGVQINGIIPALEYAVSGLDKKIVKGEGFHSGKKNEIIIGKKLADKMKLKTGARLVLTFSDTSDNIVSAAFRITAIYQSDNAPLDELNVYVSMRDLNELLLTGDAFDEIAILLRKDEELAKTEEGLRTAFPGLLVESWKDISPETDLMVKTVDQYSYIIIVIILLALAFGILNTMLMSVLERTREIGMMVALGTSRARIFLLVCWETIFLTIAGAPAGLAIAYVVIGHFNSHGLDLSGMGKDMMASFGYRTMIYPEFPWEKIVAVLIMVSGTAIISSLLPAIKALRLQPVEALRR